MKKLASTETATNKAIIDHLNLFQAKCEKKRIYPSGDIEKIKEHGELQSMAAFDWSKEVPGYLCGYFFNDLKLEIEIKEFFIGVFDRIKYERDIPLKFIRPAFYSILNAFENYWDKHEIDSNSIKDLEEKIEFALDTFEYSIGLIKI